ncbi:MAG: DJ-1/PfpI family protein [Clostridiales bacterium]|nr:DJ-1/PfpI family protein [Clostridiales bacterium]
MKVCCFLATGFEEVEALSVVDILRRGNIDTIMVSISGDLFVTGSHNITIKADMKIEDVDFDSVDMLFLPGGMPGTTNLSGCKVLCDNIVDFNAKGKRLAAVCAAPSIFGDLGILNGKKATCYPGFEERLVGATVVKDRVITDGNITTSRGIGTSLELGLELLKLLTNKESADSMAQDIQHICE